MRQRMRARRGQPADLQD